MSAGALGALIGRQFGTRGQPSKSIGEPPPQHGKIVLLLHSVTGAAAEPEAHFLVF